MRGGQHNTSPASESFDIELTDDTPAVIVAPSLIQAAYIYGIAVNTDGNSAVVGVGGGEEVDGAAAFETGVQIFSVPADDHAERTFNPVPWKLPVGVGVLVVKSAGSGTAWVSVQVGIGAP